MDNVSCLNANFKIPKHAGAGRCQCINAVGGCRDCLCTVAGDERRLNSSDHIWILSHISHALVGTGRTRLTCTTVPGHTVWGPWLASGKCLRDPPWRIHPRSDSPGWQQGRLSPSRGSQPPCVFELPLVSPIASVSEPRMNLDDASHQNFQQNWNHNLHIFSWWTSNMYMSNIGRTYLTNSPMG